MDWSGFGREFFAFLNGLKQRYWGDRTAEEDRILNAMVHALEERERALSQTPPDLSTANRWHTEFRRLRDQATTKGPRRA